METFDKNSVVRVVLITGKNSILRIMQDLYFIVVFLSTVIITRVLLYFRPTPSPTIRGFRTHHWMYGIILVLIAVLFKNIILFGVGSGLFIDELGYILIRGKTHQDNYSVRSFILLAIFVLLVYIMRSEITYLFGII